MLTLQVRKNSLIIGEISMALLGLYTISLNFKNFSDLEIIFQVYEFLRFSITAGTLYEHTPSTGDLFSLCPLIAQHNDNNIMYSN